MNINELVKKLEYIVLEKLEFKGFYLGDPFNHATGKGDKYPNVWVETPIMSTYSLSLKNHKEIDISLDFLYIPRLDDVPDEFNFMSHAEEDLDLFLQYLSKDKNLTIISATGLTIKSVNADMAAGIRLDMRIRTVRYCPEEPIIYIDPIC